MKKAAPKKRQHYVDNQEFLAAIIKYKEKVDIAKEQMVFAEATSVMPLIASDAYHREHWKKREKRNFSKIFNS